MPRKKLIPDLAVFAAIRQLLAQGGEKSVSFSTVAQATGLAPPTLVQRFGSRDAMLHHALSAAWTELEATTRAAEEQAPLNAKGAQAFLKALGADAPETADLTLLAADFRDPLLRARAEAWRAQVESALALRLGAGPRGAKRRRCCSPPGRGSCCGRWRAARGFA